MSTLVNTTKNSSVFKTKDLRDDKAKTDVEIEKITRQLHDQVERNEEIRKQLKAAAEN